MAGKQTFFRAPRAPISAIVHTNSSLKLALVSRSLNESWYLQRAVALARRPERNGEDSSANLIGVGPVERSEGGQDGAL